MQNADTSKNQANGPLRNAAWALFDRIDTDPAGFFSFAVG